MSEILINIRSFGYKYGVPDDADFIFDVRCLPNPYWVDELKDGCGLDKPVSDYVFSNPESERYLGLVYDTVRKYTDSSKKDKLNVYVGCTGGQHRSVAFSSKLYDLLKRGGFACTLSHRELPDKINGGAVN